MTSISQPAAAARESARTPTGKFGEQDHTDPEVVLGGTRLLGVNGPDVRIVMLPDGNGYEGYSFATAREKLGIPASEPDEVVEATIALVGEGEDYPPYISVEPGYDNPGDDALLSTSEWFNPIRDITWHEYADAWQGDGEENIYVRGKAVIDPAQWGWADSTEALAAVIHDHVAANADWASWGDDVQVNDGKVYLPVMDTFAPDAFEPRIVADRMCELLGTVNPSDTIAKVKHRGIVITDADLAASRTIAGRPIAYAAAAGRAPKDAEIVAVVRDFGLKTTLREGYAVGGSFADNVPEESRELLTNALSRWAQARSSATLTAAVHAQREAQ